MNILIGMVALIYLICMFMISVHKETMISVHKEAKDLETATFLVCVGLGLIATAICFK